MFSCKVSDRAQIALLWQSKAVESGDVTLVKLVVFLEHKAFCFVDSQVYLFFFVQNSVHPVAMIHIHGINVVSLDNIVVDSWRLVQYLDLLTSVLEDHGFGGRVHDITLHFAELFRQIEPVLSEFTVVEILL